MATIDEIFAGKFIDNVWDVESKSLMKDFKKAIEDTNSSGRTSKVEFVVTFTQDRETGEITPKLKFGGNLAPVSKTAASFNLNSTGQMSFDEVLDPLSAANEVEGDELQH